MVLGRGLEPPWVAPLAPKASASTNFAIPAMPELYQAENVLCAYQVSFLTGTGRFLRNDTWTLTVASLL